MRELNDRPTGIGRGWGVTAAGLATPLLVACVAPPHVPPTTGGIAEVTIVRAESGPGGTMILETAPGPTCEGKRRLGLRDRGQQEPLRTALVAGQVHQLIVSEYRSEMEGTCLVSTEFLPEAGAHYRATWSVLKSRCQLRVERREGPDGSSVFVPEPSARSNNKNC